LFLLAYDPGEFPAFAVTVGAQTGQSSPGGSSGVTHCSAWSR